MLTLIFVQSLDLNIEDSRWVHFDIRQLFDDLSQLYLVFVFDGHKVFLELGIVRLLVQLTQQFQIRRPVIPHGFVDKCR